MNFNSIKHGDFFELSNDFLVNINFSTSNLRSLFEVNTEINIVSPEQYGDAVWISFLEAIQNTTQAFGSIFLNTLQNIIFILFDGSIIYDSLNITYENYLMYILIIFISSLIILLFLRFLLVSKNRKKSRIAINIFSSILIVAMTPLFFQGLFLTTRYLLEHVFNLDWASLNIYEMINDASNNILDKNFGRTIKLPPVEVSVYIPEIFTTITFTLSLQYFGWFSNDLNLVILISTIIITWIIIYLFLKFCFRMGLRIVDIIIYGFILYPIVISSSFDDNGTKMSEWIKNLLKKIFNPFMSLTMYIVMLILINEVIGSFTFSGIDLPYDEKGFTDILNLLLVVFPFLILEVFSKRWSFEITKSNNTSSMKISNIIGDGNKTVRQYNSSDLNTTTSNISPINLNSTSTNNSSSNNFNMNLSTNQNNRTQLMSTSDRKNSLNETLDKINQRKS